MMEKNQDYFLYMKLMPEEDVPSELSSIIASSQLLETISWKELQRSLPSDVYQSLVKQTLEKYADINQTYVLVAQKYC
jgi:hypothetical protein